jgi:bZIP-type transcription factor MBZ1
MQLWTRMGQQQTAYQQQTQPTLPNTSNQHPLSGLASGLRPHYFAKSSTLSAMLSGKAAHSAYPSPPQSPALQASNVRNKADLQSATAQHAMLATMASQTLLGKLGNAFWDAFSGEHSNRIGASRSAWDAEKVRKVLEGKAVVRVVDVEPKPTHTQPSVPMAASEKAGPSRLPSRSPTLDQAKSGPSACLEKMFDGLRL